MTECHLPAATVLANLGGGVSAGLYAMSTTTLTSTLKKDEGRNNASGTCSHVVIAVVADAAQWRR